MVVMNMTSSDWIMYRDDEKLTDIRFGRLIALYPTNQKKRGYIVWKCKCDCGNGT